MTPNTAAVAARFRFFAACVKSTARLGPTIVRITFGGAELREFAGGGRDQSFSLFLPHPGQGAPVVPVEAGDGWFARWRAMDPAIRAVMRSYTACGHRPDQAELDVEFVLHGVIGPGATSGPASRWAAGARAGDRVVLLGPAVEDNKGVGFRPPPDTRSVLIAADETALPAVGGIMAWLPATVRARVWIEVPHAGDIRDLPTVAGAETTWLVRGGAGRLVEAVRAAGWCPDGSYAWVAGESGAVRALRRHLVRDRGFPPGNAKFTGYWRRGASEEDLRASASREH
jgi:NADPH-dependent ferric siderophore reductase